LVCGYSNWVNLTKKGNWEKSHVLVLSETFGGKMAMWVIA